MASGPERVQAALAGLGLDTEVVRVPGSAKTAQLAAESAGAPARKRASRTASAR